MIGKIVMFLFLILLVSGCATKIKEEYDTSKIDSKLLTGELPTYVVNDDGTLNIEVFCFRDQNINECEQIINKYGLILNKSGKNSFNVKVDKISIYKLSNEKVIRWIGEIESPKEYGNEPIEEIQLNQIK